LIAPGELRAESFARYPPQARSFAAANLRLKCDDSINPIIAKTGNYSSACRAVRHCGSLAVAFLPQVLRFLVDFRAGVVLLPNPGHAAATSSP